MAIRFTSPRENTVRFLKESAQYIYDNADDLVGNQHGVTGFDIVIHIDMDDLPKVELQRRIITGGWDAKRNGFKEYGEHLGNDNRE